MRLSFTRVAHGTTEYVVCANITIELSLRKFTWLRGCVEDESELARRRKWYAWNQMKKWWGSHNRWATRRHEARTARRATACDVGRRWQWSALGAQRYRREPESAAKRCGVFQAGPLAAPTALRNRRLCKACRCQLAAARTPLRAGRKSGTRRSGTAARAASARPVDSSEVPSSVVSVSLLERCNWVLRKSPPTAGLF